LAESSSEIERLAERRRLLVRRSDELRGHISYEVANLKPAVAWFERGYLLTQSIRSFWPIVAGAVAFFFTRKKSSWIRKIGKLWSWWRLVRSVTGVWRRAAPKLPPVVE
jgi:hypothetical protein